MNEIEIKNALQYAELQLSLSTSESKTRFFRTIVQVLRAELTRQENAPLTMEDVVSEAYDRGYNLGYSDGYQDGTKGEETE